MSTVTVLSAFDHGTLALARSLLTDAEIPYAVRNDMILDLFAEGRMGYNQLIGPAEVQVRPEDAEVASEMLALLQGSGMSPIPEWLRTWATAILLYGFLIPIITMAR
ncbi:MAG: putative signal transducing protein [Armatimonadota bacterium]